MSTGVAVGVVAGGGVWTCRGGDPDPDTDADTVLATVVEKTDCCVKKQTSFRGGGRKETDRCKRSKQTNRQANQEFVVW